MSSVYDIMNYIMFGGSQNDDVKSDVTLPLEYFVNQGVVNYDDGLPVNTVIFAGSVLENSNIAVAQKSVNLLTINGNTVTVVLVNPEIDQTNYKKIKGLNIVVWSDPDTLISDIEANFNCIGLQYLPCKSWISFTADNSLGLSSQNFQTQISFISTAVNQINHPERFQFNSGSIIVVPWSNSLSIDDIQNSILKTTQKGNDPYWLRNTLANIYASLSSQTITPPIGAIVFVTKQTTSEDLDGAFQFAKRLQIDGVTLTFVLMGPGIDQGRLGNLTKNFIIWEDLSTNGPDNWDKEYLKAYGCQ